MRFMIKFSFPNERGNETLSNPDFGDRMQRILKDMKAESAYFTAVNGERGGYVFCDMTDASQIPGIAEPLFLWLDAKVEFFPVMTIEDLGKAGPSIQSAVHNWRVGMETLV